MGNFAATQYRLVKDMKTSSMTDEHVQKLVSIGFRWACRSSRSAHPAWDERFEELQSYKAKQGHCNVPFKHKVLGRWVSKQQPQYRLLKDGKNSSMTDERVQKLVSIGFQ